MKQEAIDNQRYIEEKLNKFVDQRIIERFIITKKKDGETTYFKISIFANGLELELCGDLLKNMEITINHYFRDVTDYLIGDYKKVIDWYLEIVSRVVRGEYVLSEYRRRGNLIYRSITLEVQGEKLLIGDFHNHSKLFTKKTEMKGGQL